MRIGTWNVEGRCGGEQSAIIESQSCDVWLLTEVSHRLVLPAGYHSTVGSADMPRLNQRPFKRWAAVASRLPMAELPAPHPASAGAVIEGVTFVSSVLPWSSSGGDPPWDGANQAARMANTLTALPPFLAGQPELVWGGDWNQALSGREYADSIAGRESLLALINELGLEVPTAGLPHRITPLLAIDHIALRGGALRSQRIVAAKGGRRLSDHDMYVVEI